MKNAEITRQVQKLNFLLTKTSEASNSNLELQSHWAKYLCILIAGMLENAISELFSDFVENKSNKEINRFVIRQLEKIQNPNTQKFIEVAYGFSKEWGDELSTFVENDGRREAIDAIMSNRHLIAHGKDSGITIVKVREYLKKCIEVLEFIEKQLQG